MADCCDLTQTINMPNDDIAGIYRRINRIIREVQGSLSNDQTMLSEADRTRLASYQTVLRQYHDVAVAAGPGDYPETHGCALPLAPPPAPVELENDIGQDLVQKYVRLRNEVVCSQSANQPRGLQPADSARYLDHLTAIDDYLNNYVDAVNPVDYPYSAPRTVQNG